MSNYEDGDVKMMIMMRMPKRKRTTTRRRTRTRTRVSRRTRRRRRKMKMDTKRQRMTLAHAVLSDYDPSRQIRLCSSAVGGSSRFRLDNVQTTAMYYTLSVCTVYDIHSLQFVMYI